MAYVTQVQRKEYWLKTALLLGELMLMSVIVFALLELFNAADQHASSAQQIGAVVSFMALLLNAAVIYVMMLILILRRARDTGLTIVWFLVGAFVPFGWIAVGCIPSRR